MAMTPDRKQNIAIGVLFVLLVVAVGVLGLVVERRQQRTVIEHTREIIHDTPSSVVVTLPGGERVVLVPQPNGEVKATPVPTTTTTSRPTTSTATTVPPATDCPGVTVPMNTECVTVPPGLRDQ